MSEKMNRLDMEGFWEKAKNTSEKVAGAVVDKTKAAASVVADKAVEAVDGINSKIEEQKASEAEERRLYLENAMHYLVGTDSEEFILSLGDSPCELSESKIKKAKNNFPIPKEQNILWFDAEFDLRPSGIVITDKGIYIRTDVGVFDKKLKKSIGRSNQGLEKLTEEEIACLDQFEKENMSGKPVLYFYSWDSFESSWFTSESPMENKALLVDPKCSKRFIEVCRIMAEQIASNDNEVEDIETLDEISVASKVGTIGAAAVESAQSAVFVEQKSAINTPAGHGEMAEEAITMMDKLHGLDAKVVGRDNLKDGADRQIGDIFIQTKYYKSARGSLEACFNPTTGEYRYMNGTEPMQLEVPKDQYEKVLEGFRNKIKQGKVPGVTDPAQAEQIVRKGRLTYQQAVNLTKPGTIESLAYDAGTGAVICSCAFGLTFVTTLYFTWRNTGDLKQSIQAGASAGLQVFGISFIQHMVVSQVARTSLANSLMGPSQYVVAKLGAQASATIVNGIRALSGKSAIYGAAASKHLAKILRSNAVTSALTFVVFSVPETYNLIQKKTSASQFAKNMSVLAGSIAGGAGGAVAAGAAAAKIAGATGTAVAPGIGTVVGIAGGFVGGVVGSKVVGAVGDIFHENDIEAYGRLLNAYISCLVNEYLLDENEMDALVDSLNMIEQKSFKKLFENIAKAEQQEIVLRDYLEPYFDAVVEKREQFLLPEADDIVFAMADLM